MLDYLGLAAVTFTILINQYSTCRAFLSPADTDWQASTIWLLICSWVHRYTTSAMLSRVQDICIASTLLFSASAGSGWVAVWLACSGSSEGLLGCLAWWLQRPWLWLPARMWFKRCQGELVTSLLAARSAAMWALNDNLPRSWALNGFGFCGSGCRADPHDIEELWLEWRRYILQETREPALHLAFTYQWL